MALINLKIRHFLASLPHSEVGGGRGGGGGGEGRTKHTKVKKDKKSPPTEGATMAGWFVDIGLSEEELAAEGPPLKKNKKTGFRAGMVYKYPRARKFFGCLQAMHSVKEMHGIFVVGLEFPDLELVKIEADHPILGFDSLIAQLDERHPSN